MSGAPSGGVFRFSDSFVHVTHCGGLHGGVLGGVLLRRWIVFLFHLPTIVLRCYRVPLARSPLVFR